MTTPILILVNPQMGENIGAVARAMMNFGLRELRLVAPRDGWPNEKATEMAAHGAGILESAKLYPTVKEAIADLHVVYASTARARDQNKPQFTPREAFLSIAMSAARNEKVGILFGPERTGLVNEDVALAGSIITIPADPGNASLNVAQSAVVLGYEWFQATRPIELTPTAELATQEEITQLFDFMEETLDKTGYFASDEKKPITWRNLRAIFLRATPSKPEINALRGMMLSFLKSEGVTKR